MKYPLTEMIQHENEREEQEYLDYLYREFLFVSMFDPEDEAGDR